MSSSTETAVSSAEKPDPGQPDESGPPPQSMPRRAFPVRAYKPAPRTKPVDVHDANGRDDPAESEHDHDRQKLHGESARRLKRPQPD